MKFQKTLWTLFPLLLLFGCVHTWKKDPPQKTAKNDYLSKEDFKSMVSTGVPESRIEEMLRKNKEGFYLTTDEILQLRQSNASNRLIWISMHPQKEYNGGGQIKKVKKEEKLETRPEKNQNPKKEDLAKKEEPKKDGSSQGVEKREAKKTDKQKYPSLFYYGYGDKDGDNEESLPPTKKKTDK